MQIKMFMTKLTFELVKKDRNSPPLKPILRNLFICLNARNLAVSLRGSLFVKGGLVDIDKGLPVGLHHLEDIPPHGAVLSEDP